MLRPRSACWRGLGLAILLARIDPTQRRRGVPCWGFWPRWACWGSACWLGTWSSPIGSRTTSGPGSLPGGSGPEKSRDGELACLKTDLGLSFQRRLWRVGMSAVYLFHQRKFSERHRRHARPDLDPASYSETRPLRLVAFDHLPADVSAFEQWLAVLGRSFELRRTETYEIQPGKPTEDWLRDAYVVLEWVPRVRRPSVAAERRTVGGRRL